MSTYRSLTLRSLTVTAVLVVAMLGMTIPNSFALDGNTFARVETEPYTPPGTLDGIGLTDIAEVASVKIELYDDVNCPVGPGVPCDEGTDSTPTSPPTGDVPGSCGAGCEEYRVTFDPVTAGADTTPGNELHIKVYFYDASGALIDDQGKDIRIHSFLVIPESPIGMLALVGAALAGLGGFYLLKGRNAVSNVTKI